MRAYRDHTFSAVYKSGLSDLFYNPDFVSKPRGSLVKENLGVSMEFHPASPMFNNTIKSSELEYINGELEWYFKGLNDVEFIANYSKFWNNVCNPDGTCNSAYGKLIFKDTNKHGYTQYEWVMSRLIRDLETRQAIMLFNKPRFQYDDDKDFVCTSYVMLLVRENYLYMRVHMRSNDAILGTPNDVVFFSILQQQVLRHLRRYYPNIILGTYTHLVDSFHIYENKFKIVEKMLKNRFDRVDYLLKYDIIEESGKFKELKKI